jgi:DAACS family dicarboxylate/amino acid:cation (Na+ or H+) symporter
MPDQPRRLAEHTKILLGLLLGAVAGVVANALFAADPDHAVWLRRLSDGIAYPIGQVFLRLLMLVVMPLVFASLALGTAQLGDLRKLGTMGARTLSFFLLTSAFSVVLGLGAMNAFAPGKGFDQATRTTLMSEFGGDATRYQAAADARGVSSVLDGVNQVLDAFLPRNVLAAVIGKEPGRLGDMLPLIVLSLLFGVALTGVSDARRQAMMGWLETLGEVMVRIVRIAMRLAPYAVFCLIFHVTSKFGLGLLQKLSVYVVIVLGCYVAQIFVFYPVLIRLMAGRAPLEFLRRCIPLMVTAFSTSSSNATLPTTLRIAREDLGVRPSVAGFVLPLGATINMNGTALFEGAVVLFVAQIFGVELTLVDQALVVLMCVLAAVGTAGVPGGSIPLLMIVMARVGVPPDGIAIVLGVDRLLDMGRTVVNVMGDVVCAAFVERTELDASDGPITS